MFGTGLQPGACTVRSALLLGGVMLALAAPGMATPACAQAVVSTGVGTPFELAFWQSIDSSNDPSLYESYLQRFPNGTFGEIARAKIINLRGRLTPQPAPTAVLLPATPNGTVPVAPPAPAPYVPTVPVVATTPVAQPAVAPVAVAATPVMTPTATTSAVATPAAITSAATVAPVVQAQAATPAAVTTVAPATVATSAPAPVPPANTLGQLLAALANSQTNSQASGGAATAQNASYTPSAPAAAPALATTPSAAPALAAPAIMAPLALPSSSRTLAAGFFVPAQPALTPVAGVALPASFCSAEARNAFHDTVYVPSINAAKQNNDAAAAYMRELQAMYDQYQLSHDPDTMNAIVAAARGYQPVAQTTFSMQSALVRQFTALMAVPVVPCSQPGQPSPTTLAK